MANNKKVSTAIVNTIEKAVLRGFGSDNKFGIEIKKEVDQASGIRVYDLFLAGEMVYTIAIDKEWNKVETVFTVNEFTKAMKKEVAERIFESRSYGFNDI